MFSEEQLRAYRKVTAPAALHSKVVGQGSATYRAGFLLPRFAAMAACLLLIFSAAFLLFRENSLSVVLQGEELEESLSFSVSSSASAMRSAPDITLPLEILPKGETVIRVSRGSLLCPNGDRVTELTVTERITLEWGLPQEEKDFSCKMELLHRNESVRICLSYDADTQRITATKTEK